MGMIETGDKKSFDIALNIVPFIDLMSCLTAFLLVTAVWSDHAQIDVEHQRGGPASRDKPIIERPQLAILIQPDTIYVGVTQLQIDPVIARATDGRHDWDTIAAALASLRREEAFDERRDYRLAAESTAGRPVPYGDLVKAMDVAAAAGFDAVNLTEPRDLQPRPTL